MSSQLLVNVLTVTVPASGSVTVPHGLKSNGKDVAPTLILPEGASSVSATVVTPTSVTFVNSAGYAVTSTFRVERGLSMEVDAEDLPLVKVGSASSGSVSGIASALKPAVFSPLHQMAWIPVYPYDGANPAKLIKLGVEGEESFFLCGGRKNPASNNDTAALLALERTWVDGGLIGRARLRAGSIDGGAQGAAIQLEVDVSVFTGVTVTGNRGGIGLNGALVATEGLACGSPTSTTPVAGTPIPLSTSTVALTPAAPVNMDETSPQIAMTYNTTNVPMPEGVRITLYNKNASPVTLTNAAGGGMKLRTSPLVIAQYEAYDFLYDGTYWIQVG